MATAAEISHKQQQERLDDEELWATNVVKVLRRLTSYSANDRLPDDLTDEHAMDTVLKVEFDRVVIDEAVRKDEELRAALDALEIDRCDHMKLSDILDPDHSGTVGVLELV